MSCGRNATFNYTQMIRMNTKKREEANRTNPKARKTAAKAENKSGSCET